MANKNTNQLLSSVISPLHDLPSVLLPSVPVLETTTGFPTDYKILSKNESCQPASITLQPHLSLIPAQFNIPTESFTKSMEVKASEESSACIIGPPMGIPKLPNTGESFMRKPTNKYVVPPEIDVQNKAADLISTKLPVAPPSGQFMVPSVNDPVENISNSELDFSSRMSFKPVSFESMADSPPPRLTAYHPVIHHWFYNETKQSVSTWHPFSFTDSLNLEEAYRQGSPNVIATDGGRFDVNVTERKKTAVYWEGKPYQVRRCSWFRKEFSTPLPVPYSEEDSNKLEAEFKEAFTSSSWHRQVELSGGERVMIHSPTMIQHYQLQEPLEYPNTVSMSQQTPQVVRRGADDFTIPECAADKVDHLLFLIHGIGSFCDLSFRCVEECVDDFRKLGEDLLASHFKESIEAGRVGRIEFLPISWHKALHGDATGIDKKLKLITLRSIPKFREFTNDTVLDVLFFTSPVYGQHIMDTVASEMERLLTIFKSRNPTFGGKVSVGGHSLGTVILFDLLRHQKPTSPQKEEQKVEQDLTPVKNDCVKMDSNMETMSPSMSKVNFEIGAAGTGQPAINYPQLSFKPEAFFLMGSPVGMFITVRGLETLGSEFKLPTCDRVFNIFHPFDPVAYRIETLIDPTLSELRPVLIPHHKGRKRMHLELKDTIERVGSDIKNRIVDSIQATWNTMYQLYSGDFSSVNQALEDELMKNADMAATETVEPPEPQVRVGKLNGGRRIDYVLQEKPYESFTEYIFALQAHLTYWSSEDTLLMILKEIYGIEDIHSDTVLQAQRRDVSVATGANVAPAEIPSAASLPGSMSSSTPKPPFGATDSVLSSSVTPSAPFAAPPPTTVPFMVPGSDISNAFATPPSIQPPTMLPFDRPPPPLPSIGISPSVPRVISGRPVFDPSMPPTVTGVDPTASPASSAIGPPPKLPKVSFNKK